MWLVVVVPDVDLAPEVICRLSTDAKAIVLVNKMSAVPEPTV